MRETNFRLYPQSRPGLRYDRRSRPDCGRRLRRQGFHAFALLPASLPAILPADSKQAFEVVGIHIQMGFPSMDFTDAAVFFKQHGIRLELVPSRIYDILKIQANDDGSFKVLVMLDAKKGRRQPGRKGLRLYEGRVCAPWRRRH